MTRTVFIVLAQLTAQIAFAVQPLTVVDYLLETFYNVTIDTTTIMTRVSRWV